MERLKMLDIARWRTGVLLSIFFAIILLSPPLVFLVTVAVVLALAAWEWGRLADLGRARLPYAASFVLLFIFFVQRDWILPLSIAALFWWVAALRWILLYPSSVDLWGSHTGRSLMGVAVLLPACTALVLLYRSEHGVFLIVFLVLLVAAVDIGAWLAGYFFGESKLLPEVSPKKTWAGLWGGIFSAMAVVCIAVLFFESRFFESRWHLFLCGLLAAVSSILGDLLESMVKRRAGRKDSGTLLPGHGGVLDRIDGLCAAAPVFTVCWFLP